MDQFHYMVRRLPEASYGGHRISWLEGKGDGWSGPALPPATEFSRWAQIPYWITLETSRESKLYLLTAGTHTETYVYCWKGEVLLSAFPLPPPCWCGTLTVCQVKSCLRWIITRTGRTGLSNPSSWSTVFASLSPRFWWRNFLGIYTMIQTRKLIWLKDKLFPLGYFFSHSTMQRTVQ